MKKLFYWGPKNQAYPKGNWLYELYRSLESKLFLWLLKRFCAKDLDQWARWQVGTKYGPVYVQISRQDDGYKWEELK
jgi:hypothetical protein